MAYKLSKNGYGTGLLGDVSNPTEQINSYASVTSYTSSTVTIGSVNLGGYEKFEANSEIMIHVSSGSSADFLGKYLVCKISAVDGNVLTVTEDFTQVLPILQSANYHVQVITAANFNTLSLDTGSISPVAYDTTSHTGGILFMKCANALHLAGGKIYLGDTGIPNTIEGMALRPETAQELQGAEDTDQYAGWENHMAESRFLLNVGDGAAFIVAKTAIVAGSASRIGGSTAGVRRTRGENLGGSTIVFVAGEISGWTPEIISKTKGSGKGLGRCYIASDTKLPYDEGLYAFDVISNPQLIMKKLNIKDYGTAILGNGSNPTSCINNYGAVSNISADGLTVTCSSITTNGIAKFEVGAWIMFHVSKPKNIASDSQYWGKFILAQVLLITNNSFLLDTPVSSVFPPTSLSSYNCQLITVAQYGTLTISGNYNFTPKWDGAKGGICAVACRTRLDLSNGMINVEEKGGGIAVAGNALNYIGNSQNSDCLPLGAGHGSVFVLTRELQTNSISRIGGTYSGIGIGGQGGAGGSSGGYKQSETDGGAVGAPVPGLEGSTERGFLGTNKLTGINTDGNSLDGASIFAIINVMPSFSLSAFSTGGKGKAGAVGTTSTAKSYSHSEPATRQVPVYKTVENRQTVTEYGYNIQNISNFASESLYFTSSDTGNVSTNAATVTKDTATKWMKYYSSNLSSISGFGVNYCTSVWLQDSRGSTSILGYSGFIPNIWDDNYIIPSMTLYRVFTGTYNPIGSKNSFTYTRITHSRVIDHYNTESYTRTWSTYDTVYAGKNGDEGYGGGAGYAGGTGGSGGNSYSPGVGGLAGGHLFGTNGSGNSGFCFIYSNNVVAMDNTGVAV